MTRKALIAAAIGMVLSVGGITWADPEGSQLLRGLGGRTFAVVVTNLTTGEPPFGNCYTFNDDGSWDDPLFLPGFPIPGTWTQHSAGASTSYTATAYAPIDGVVGVLLTQIGTVTPANGDGTLQLEADNTVDIVLEADPSVVIFPLLNLKSVGYQDNDCAS